MIEDIKNIANILFFVAASTVGVLTYLHARKTVFAPLRTETFKLQLKVLEELLLFFQHKDEIDFCADFDLQRIVSLNALQMRDAYVKIFFKEKLRIDDEKRREAYEPLRFALVSPELIEVLDDETHRRPTPTPEVVPDTPALSLAKWQAYKHDAIGYTKEFHDKDKELLRFAASPLLPQKLRDLIEKFRKAEAENIVNVGKTVTSAATRMPEKFATAQEVMEFRTDWVWNIFNDQSAKVEPIAKEILAFINRYLNVDGLEVPKN